MVKKIFSLDFYSMFKTRAPEESFLCVVQRGGAFGVIFTIQLEPPKLLPVGNLGSLIHLVKAGFSTQLKKLFSTENKFIQDETFVNTPSQQPKFKNHNFSMTSTLDCLLTFTLHMCPSMTLEGVRATFNI